MEAQEILKKFNTDIEYIPTLEEFTLIKDMEWYFGESPTYKIIILDEKERELIEKIEEDTTEERPSGLTELYYQLIEKGRCITYSEDRIYYLAYTLVKEHITFDIRGLEYKSKYNKKVTKVLKYVKELGLGMDEE